MTSGKQGDKKGKESARPDALKGDAARAERLRAALRENLRRRKAQAKAKAQAKPHGGGSSHDSAGFMPDKSED